MNRGSTTPQQTRSRMSRDITPRRDVVPARYIARQTPVVSRPGQLGPRVTTWDIATPSPVLAQNPVQAQPPVVSTIIQPTLPKKKIEKEKKRRFVRYGMPGIATMLIVTGILLVGLSLTNNIEVTRQLKAYAESAADSGEKDASSTSQTSSNASSSNSTGSQSGPDLSTDPTKPRHIAIASAGIDAPTVIVGLNKKNEIGTPANIKYTAWYEGSSSPLDKQGTSIIVGHRGTDRYVGVFGAIDRLHAGTEIKLTMGDGTVIGYKVVSQETVSSQAIDMSKYMSYKGNTNRILYLITCEGTYDESTHTYPDRVIVKAVGTS